MKSPTCPLCKKESDGPAWVYLWPFNFEMANCPVDGFVDSEDWLWQRIWSLWGFFNPWDGRIFFHRHPWWKFSMHFGGGDGQD